MSKLKLAPLQEVIFEILWDIEIDEKGFFYDPDFALAQGLFANELKSSFPIRKRIIPEELVNKLYPKTVYQFWKSDNQWPVVQIGPGILAVNDTEKNYDWEANFCNLINESMVLMEKSYNKQLTYKRVSLRYVDAVDILNNESIIDFVNRNFKVSIKNNYETFGSPLNINFNQTFKVDATSLMNFSISSALNNHAKPSIVWQTQIFTDVKMNIGEVLNWVNNAHNCASVTFKNTLQDEFYSSFK